MSEATVAPQSERISLIGQREKRFYTVTMVVVLAVFLLSSFGLSFNPFAVIAGSGPLFEFLAEDFLPPALPRMDTLLRALNETVALALTSVFAAAILAFFAAILGSAKISPIPALGKVIRGGATLVRNIPDLVWAFILFTALGIGTGVGFVALTLSTYAFLVRAFIDSIDEASTEADEALQVVGASFPQRVAQCIVPSCIKDFISWALFSVEVNIRGATIVGMVGGGGIGLMLFSHLRRFQYGTAAGMILALAALVIAVDLLTNYLRRRLLAHG